MIETRNLQKIYRTDEIETIALNNVNLVINPGEFVAIMGPSGCGKSTLLNVLGLIDNPSHGEYHFLGQEVSTFSERQRAKVRRHNIGFIFQSFNLIEELTVYENIELPLLYQKVAAKERASMVDEIIVKMGIGHRKSHFPQQLSGGQQQRVAVSRAMVGKPKPVLADEPTGNLDSSHGDEVLKQLTKLHEEGTTVVMVTHSPEYADQCQRIIHLFDGHIVTENIVRRKRA